jgi:protein arginine N-methyltransferase 5
MDSSDDLTPPFCVGQHETQRNIPISLQVVQQAHESNVRGYVSALLL